MPNSAPPRVFAIGLPHSGGAVLAALFEANGYKWDHHKSGKLAQDLAYAQATGTMPFVGRESVVGFSDIYRMHKRHLPPLAVQDYLAFLLHQFPDAYFVNTRRDVADWIADRFWAEDGEHRFAAAWHAGIGEADLPQHWMTEDTQHESICKDVFKGHDRFLSFNISSEPIENIAKFFSEDFNLNASFAPLSLEVSADDIDAVVTYIQKSDSHCRSFEK